MSEQSDLSPYPTREEEQPKPKRDARGRLLPGQPSLNPAGRGAGPTFRDHIETQRRKRGKKVIKAMFDRAEEGNVQAAELLISHAEGKPRQSVDVGISDGDAEQIALLRELIASREQGQIVDGESRLID